MAQFRGTVEGARGGASRLGHKTTGLSTTCNGWHIGVACEARHIDGKDVIEVYTTSGSGPRSTRHLIATVTDTGEDGELGFFGPDGDQVDTISRALTEGSPS